MGKTKKADAPRSRKVLITFDEYQAIQLGLSEIEGSIGYGDLPEKDVEKYKKSEILLRNLLTKIINSN